MSKRVVRALAAMFTGVTLLSGCRQAPPEPVPPIFNEDVPTMDLSRLPTAKESQTQMLGLVENVRREIARLVPATNSWKWYYEWGTTSCDGGIGLLFPQLVSDHGLAETEWTQIYPVAVELAAQVGLTQAGGFQNSPGNHDARISSSDGRMLILGTRDATVLSASVSCRRTDGESLWVAGAIPMPPDPQP